MKLASADFDRARQLRDKGVTAAGDFDQRAATFQQATGAFQSARAALDAAKLNLEFCTVTAPIDGRVGLANVTVGNLVSADGKDPLTTIVSTNPVYAYADVDERSLLRYVRYYQSKMKGPEDADEVKIPVELSLQDEEGFPHRGYIDFIDNRVDPSTGTIRIRGVFDFENGLLGSRALRAGADSRRSALQRGPCPRTVRRFGSGSKVRGRRERGQHGRVSAGPARHAF